MENDNAKPTRTQRPMANQQLPPLRPRALPPMPSLDMGDEMPPAQSKKKRLKREPNEIEDTDEPGVEMEGMVSHRQSESREPLTPEPQDIPAQKKKKRRKKRKKAQTSDLEQEGDSMQPDVLNRGDAWVQHTDDEEVIRKAKKKKPIISERQYPDDLDVEDDDVVTGVPVSVPQHSLFSAPLGQSQPVSKVFVERNRRFQAADHTNMAQPTSQMDDYLEIRSLWTTRDVALKIHNGFRVIGLFAQGLLAGYTVWNITVVYILAGEQLARLANLLLQFNSLAYPAQSLLYLLLAISTVSAFDRVNLAKASVVLRGLLTLNPAALASVLYFAALILSLSQQMTCDRINLYNSVNGTLWPTGSEQKFLQPWIVVNLVVALLVGLAWAFVATEPELDYTREFLQTMDVDEDPQREKTEIPA